MNKRTTALIKKHTYFNQQFFARWAKLYDYEKYIMFPLRNTAAASIPLPKKSTIIDVATGTGAQAYALAQRGYDVTGLDLSKEMLEQAQKKIIPSLKLRFIHGDGTKLPFKSNMFDGASISLGLHDMPYEIRLLVLREILRVTKPMGKILIVDYLEPEKYWLTALAYHIERRYETPMFEDFLKRGLTKHLKEVGLIPDTHKTFWKLFQIVICTNKKS